jgi:hypothetical protein
MVKDRKVLGYTIVDELELEASSQCENTRVISNYKRFSYLAKVIYINNALFEGGYKFECLVSENDSHYLLYVNHRVGKKIIIMI